MHGLETVETSALEGMGVTQAFTRLAFEIHARSMVNTPVRSGPAKATQPVTLQEGQKKKNCC
jgi:hypothetical protein